MTRRLSAFASELAWNEFVPDLSSTAFVSVLNANPKRWAIMTAPRNTDGYEISVNPGAKPGTDFFIAESRPFIFTFNDLGPMIQAPWLFRNPLGTNSVVVYEIYIIEG